MRLSDGAVAKFESATPIVGYTSQSFSVSGATAVASGTYSAGNRANINNLSYANLATFEIKGLSSGSATLTIEELTIGDGDFTLGQLQTLSEQL